MYIKDDEINKYFNEPNWKVAHNLFQHNTISNMSVIKDGQIYQIVYLILSIKKEITLINYKHFKQKKKPHI